MHKEENNMSVDTIVESEIELEAAWCRHNWRKVPKDNAMLLSLMKYEPTYKVGPMRSLQDRQVFM